MTVRLKDLAEKAGVSIRTVTRALKDANDINPGTRMKIQSLAKKLNYRPHRGAQNLKTQKSKAVVLVVKDLDELTVEKTAAFEQTLRLAGYSVELLFEPGNEKLEKDLLSELSDRQPAGIASVRTAPELVKAAEELQIPFVEVDAPEGCRHDAVIIDRPQGVYEAVTHLLRNGIQRPMYVGLEIEGDGRLRGFRRALREWPATVRGTYLTQKKILTGKQFEFGQKAAGQIAAMDQGHRPDGIQCYSDKVALGLLHGFHKAGIAVPEEISVVGFDDRAAAAVSWPLLTTVAQPNEEVGRAAAKILLERIEEVAGKKSRKRKIVVVPTRLMIRESA